MHPIDYFWRSASRFPNKVAIISGAGQLTYSALARVVLERAAELTALGAEDGAPVCIGAANSVDHLVQILAVLAAGHTWVPLNPRNGDPELRRTIDFVRPAAVFLDGDMAARLTGIAPEARALGKLGGKTVPFGSLRMGPAAARGVSLDRTQAIKFTGGTTGVPKGVKQPLRAWNANIVTQLYELGLGPQDRYLVAAPLTHGTSTYMLPILAAGGSLVFPEEAKPAALLDAAERHEVSVLFGPPTLVFALMDEQRHYPRALPALRYLVYGGAPMRSEKITEAQSLFGDVLCTSYGQTEAPQIITFLPPDEMKGELMASVGRPTVLTQLAILSETGECLPRGEEGEIAVRGDLVMTGYLDAPEETNRVLVDGWLRTGDAGLIDPDGHLFIRDRLRDVIITGGFNVYPGDVEVVLARHTGIADCSVVGVPDSKWGEAVHAAVQLREGASLDVEALITAVKQELGSVKAPKHVHIFDALPRSAVGKTVKAEVRSEILRREAQA
ncbi:class I adenylate-forming enzyme family protein [Ensifer adhaerens]|uniref:class I adenylate-forming enzyme family protein n=1 Tax=Ensifer adhaerens TaxID=106592 RepID=UPI000FD7FC38|nr:AMP-binding protein [Ensifer adhaerens]MDF8357647.1 AMP-binding protein [Ensifer adhaerens]THA60208.1 long-chain fatty acid--CoA ligase [Ensifer adhaerens]